MLMGLPEPPGVAVGSGVLVRVAVGGMEVAVGGMVVFVGVGLGPVVGVLVRVGTDVFVAVALLPL